ncbi:MAG: hypothetical protein ABW161_19420 [Candidatus Thiodiazotropha sp.]
MSFALLMGMSAAMSSESVSTALDKQVKPVMTVLEEVHQYTPLGIVTDWISLETTEPDLWTMPDKSLDAVGLKVLQELRLAMEWRLAPQLALLPWHGQGAWDDLYEALLCEPLDVIGRHKERYDGRLPVSEDPETQAQYQDFFSSDREVSEDAREAAIPTETSEE